MARPKHPPIQRDWLSKSLAGCVLGFSLALALCGLVSRLMPGLDSAEAQLLLWLLPLPWLAVLGTVFLFRNGRQAWLWLSMTNAAMWSLLLISKSL